MNAALSTEFRRVSKTTPCPVCSKPDWCMISRQNSANFCRVICARTPSARAWGAAGYLHVFGDVPARSSSRVGAFKVSVIKTLSTKFEALASVSATRIAALDLKALAKRLVVTTGSLRRLGTGFITRDELAEVGTATRTAGVFTFPMFDDAGRVCGVRLRGRDGGKFCINGSQNGLFMPTGLTNPPMRMFVAEGETDTAALLDLGFDVIGKPGAGNADTLTVRFLRRARPGLIVVVADNDAIGRDRADRLARRLALDHRGVRVIVPPEGIKDAREWKKLGADQTTIETAVEAASSIRLTVTLTRRGS